MTKKTVDIGSGQTVPRHHPPEHLVRALDQANAAVEAAQAQLRQWIKPLYRMRAPADFNAFMNPVNAPGMSGIAYGAIGPGEIIDVDERDVAFFRNLKFERVET